MTVAAPVLGVSIDWSAPRSYWPGMFNRFGLTGRPGLLFLEIGCFEGMATRWLVENVLTDPSSGIVVIDTFAGSPEFSTFGLDASQSRRRFNANLAPWIADGRIEVIVGRSQYELLRLPATPMFDFAYIDGSHAACDVIEDAVNAWTRLKPGGLLVFDDYVWDGEGPDWAKPRAAIDAFVRCYEPQIRSHAEKGTQYVVVR